MRNAFTKPVLLAIVGALYGCSGSAAVEVSPPPAPATGTLTVTWTIEGVAAPQECDAVGAASLELAVFDTGGVQAADVFANCTDFAISIDLPDGIYSADVTLLDPADNDVSTTLTLDGLDIRAGTELTSDIDFPTGSIL